MPIYRHVVNIRETDDGNFDIDVHYGPRMVLSTVIDADMTVEEFLRKRLALNGGDRIEVNFLDENNPTARVGKSRPAGPGRPRKKAVEGSA